MDDPTETNSVPNNSVESGQAEAGSAQQSSADRALSANLANEAPSAEDLDSRQARIGEKRRSNPLLSQNLDQPSLSEPASGESLESEAPTEVDD